MKGKMKKVVSLLLSIAMIFTSVNILPSTVEAAVNSSSGSSSWSLVWNDEFNQTVGEAPDSSTWSYDIGHGDNGWGNQELQRYTNSTDNVRIVDMSSDSGSTDGKALAITAKRENGEITSGRIKTLNKQYLKYGRVEARLRLDDGMRSGVWPAFWMMGNDIESGAPWPYCGEIDIMEHRNAEKQIISTLHWNTGTGASANNAHVYSGSETTNQYGNIDSINDWHNYAVEWYEDVVKFYLDGVCFETLNINNSEMEEFQKEHFILLNLAIGSINSPFTKGETVSDDFQSATMYVDYVRVYQGNDSAFSIAKTGTSETKPTQTTTGDGFTTCSSEKTSLGGWGYYVLGGNAGKYQNGTNLDDEFVLKLTSNNKSAWGVQAFTKNISVTSGHKYNVSVDVNSSAATGDVLMKDEIGGTEFTNQALSAGNNTLTGSFTANSDTMQFMFNLANVDAGTTLKFSNVKVTDVTGSGEVGVTTTAQETTPVSVDSSWEVIGGGDANTWYYDKNSMSGISNVVNIQQPGFAKEKGIYITVPKRISSVSVNGNTEGVAAIQDAGAVVYLSALTKQINTVTINYAGGTGTVIIKNTNGTSDGTTTETQTESQTPTETINAADPYADAKTVLTAPKNAYLYNFTQEGNGYKLSFTKADNSSVLGEKTGTEKYALYVNDKLIKEINATELTVNASNNTATVSLAEGDVSKNGLTKGQQQKVSVREIYNVSDSENYYSPKSATTTFMYGNVESPYADDVPQIFISSSRLADGSGKKNDNVDLLTDTSKTKVNAAIVVKDEKGNNTSYSNIGNIKVRGNSTALTEKKPYNISFNEATDLFGMGKAKKWSLLANAFDKSLIRNKLAMDFQRTLESTYTPNNVYTSNCKFVDLYVDGTFLGNYLLIESVETGSSRVAINDGYVDDTDNAKTESEPAKVTINGTEYSVYDALLELANDVTETGSRYDEGTYYFKTNGCSEIFSINAPERSNTSYGYKESDTNKPEWVTNINTYLNGFETVLNQPATTDKEQKAQFDLISQFIDVDSFVNFYITEEYFMCKDVNFSSTRFYTKGGKLYAGPLWDLDLSSGNIVDHNGYEDYYAQHFAWFNKLMTNKYFKEKVINRFTDVQPIIKQIYAENGTMDTEINSAKKSIDRNYLAKSEGGAGWELNRRYTGDNYSNNVNKMYTEYASYISDLRTWLQGRNTWLSATTQWNVTDDEYTWIAIPNSNYYYFVPEGNQHKVTNANVASEKILLAYGAQGFNATKVTVDGTEISSDNYESTGSVEFKIKESVLAKNGHPYKVAVYTENSGDTPYFTVYLKKTAPEDYVPKGFAATVDNSGLLTATWTTTSDANAAAATYEVKVGTEIAKVTGSTATYKLSTYGKYKVTLTTRIGSEIKDTQTLELTYSDPDTVGGTLTVSENWEAERAESLVWTEVKNATGYGIYVDGKLYKTTNATKEKIPAYVFAEKSENTNKLSKPTTVGNHTTTVLALFDDEKAPELLTDGKSKNIVGEPYDTTLYVNYIFGTGTNLWNKSISDNVWNFTVCEAIDKKGVTKGALADVEYNDDGSATVKFNDMGENTQSDSSGNRQQPWNVKGALYNIPTENDKEVTVSFDIIGPACLAEKKSGYPGEPEGEEKTQGITINFTPEEIVNGAYGAAYKYAKYYFEPATVNGKQVSVLHYSENVKTTNTSYDLLFGLGDLVFSGDDKTLTLTNPVTSTVYGVDTVDAKGLYTSDGKGAAYVGFTSTVPNRQEPYYTYKVSVLDGETTLEEQVVDNPSHITLKNGETGYVPGKEYTVKVESIYAITNEVTATKTATVTIPNEAEKKADLVISSVINKRTNSTTVADSVFRTGESVDVKVTVSNIGSVTSETTKLGLYNASLENTPLLDEKDVPAIEPGQSVTLTFTNTLASEPNEYHFLLKVNADKTTSESDYTNNNSNTEIKAYAPITDDLKITDSETAHRISWESVDGATSYEIRYSKKDGTEARAIVSGTTEYQLTEIPKEGTEIQLWAVESDNTKYEVKYTVPKADMIISALKMVSEPSVDQYYRVGDTIKYEVTMKNIGLGKAVAKDGKITIHLVAGKNNNTESMIEKAYAVSANGNDINNISSGDSVTVTMETVLSDSDLGEIYFGGRADADGDIDEGNENNNYSIISTPVIVKKDGSQWIKVNATDGTDADKLPFYYHDDTYETKGTFFYACSDMNLSSITSYNGNHLAVQLDNSTVPDLTKLNWRVAITTASVDDKGNFKIPTKSDEDYEVQIQSSTDGIVGVKGTGRLLMKLPEIMEQLPVHSDNGGTRDSNYYYMKIFYDTTDTSNPYVAIPIKVEADIPKIEEIHGMTVAKRGDNLSVQWTNTTTQDEHGYTYDIYIRDVKNNGEFVKVTDTPVVAGNYNFKDYDLQTIGNEYEVKVVGKWGGHCQSTEKTLSYKVVAPEKNRDYITDETFNYDSLSNDKWMPISGEHNLPVHLENTVSATVNADIYYYTDKDLDNAIGYNGSYISLVGNEKYFTGSTSSLYVKNGNTYKYESRNIYDNFYKGQILMNVAELFTTYGDYTDVSELYDRAMYYTVRVYGNNGANYKDYYFKIVPKPDGSTVEQSSGKWREISGEHKLPVTFSDLKLDGDVYFYDYKSKTNTYDIRGYNGEYMSLLGKKENYRAGTTTVQISKPISMNMASDFDRKTGTNSYDTDKYIEKAKAGTLHEIYGNATYTSDDSIFESKNIYESVYDGFINAKASDVVSVSYGTNFYILKITNGDNVAYVPMKVVVKSGDVEVQGFQINYDKGAGSASEFNPATRIVSRACKVMTVGDTLHRVKEHGTIFGVADYIKSSDMTLDSTSNYVSHMATTAKGLYNGYVSGLNDDDTYNYYGFTIKWNTYNYSALTTKYSYRAYAKLDNNQVVYGHKIYTANTYEVAENLYNNSKMPNVQAHDFLYDNILNIVDMGTNRKYISYAMVKALNVRKTTDPKYKLINTVFQDIYDYVRCSDKAYTYQDRKPFECKDANVESELLGYLNNASKELHGSDFAEYKSLADWIYGETGNYGQSSMPSYPGCYKKTDFGWGSNIFTDYDSE